MHGGAVQGVGWGLFEQMVFDDQGTPITGSLMDYTVPKASQSPSVEAIQVEVPSTLGPFGAKGVGESATVGAPPAIANAVVDALSHLGVTHVEIPITPPRLWRILQDKGVAL